MKMLRASIIGILQKSSVGLFSTRALNQNKINAEVLLTVADDFMQQGKVHTAEDIYTNTIEKYPACAAASRKLWNSWVSHRSLKVTKKELNDFMTKYELNISQRQSSDEPLPSIPKNLS